jgi:RNA polymerase sigma-70 factor (ECF subfamily)
MMDSHPGPTDQQAEEALRRTRAGDSEAFAVVVARYELPIRAWLASVGDPRIDLDEVAQRTFIAAFTNLHRFEEGTDLAAWLFAVARFQLRTELATRRRARQRLASGGHELVQRLVDRAVEEPPETAVRRLAWLAECLKGLAPRARDLVRWRYEDRQPLVTVAKRTGRSLGAVKKHLWKVRRALHLCIDRKMAEEDRHNNPGQTP